jgi:dihydroorotate dehydrogenase (fumarate)
MNLNTTYLGLHLSSPLMPGASPLADEMDSVRRLEDAGAGAIVMHSLFEEQLTGERLADIYHRQIYSDSNSEALSYFPRGDDFMHGPEQYLEQLRRVKAAVKVPVIGSLNGSTLSGWIDYARQIQQAGADALELNVYYLPTDPQESGAQVETRVTELVKAVRQVTTLPLAVKLSPFYSSLPHLACQLDEIGVDGLVLFNRFYQPDIDIDALETTPRLQLSDPGELLLRLRWLAILSPHVRASLACSGGVDSGRGAIQSIMAGASAVQVVSALLRFGPLYLKTIREQLVAWMTEHEYESVHQMHGSMNLSRCPDPGAFERANYMRVLQSVRLEGPGFKLPAGAVAGRRSGPA